MLTRPQIQRLAQKYGIGIQAQERDYIQHILLFLVSSRSQALLFKGGTALRIVYGSGRYSEDLDFNATIKVEKIKILWSTLLNDLMSYGINAEIRNDWQSETGYSFDVSYQGPLFDGRDRTKGKVRLDVSLRHEAVETTRELVTSEYADVRPFVVIVLTREHMMAEKVRALILRGKPRDLYDLWLLSRQGVQLDRSLVKKKLDFVEVDLTRSKLESVLEKVKHDWKRDLQPLLSPYIPWSDITSYARSLLDELID
jgi:predicted nucleotidyltransferase component of viral defense system